jgi:hypothetical protein
LNIESNGGDGQLNVDGAGVHDRNAHDRDADEPTGAEEEEVFTGEGLIQQQLPELRELLDNCSSVADAVQKANKFGMCEEATCGDYVLRHVDDMISYSCFRPRRLGSGKKEVPLSPILFPSPAGTPLSPALSSVSLPSMPFSPVASPALTSTQPSLTAAIAAPVLQSGADFVDVRVFFF